MLSKKVVQLINEQINKEFFSAYLYLDMANYYAQEGLNGFANWFRVQDQEEDSHAKLFIEYLHNNGEKVTLTAIGDPDTKYADFKAPLIKSLEHERLVTASINNIYKQAFEEKDFRTMQFLDWFIKEQGEEEKNADELIQKYTLFATDGKGLYMMDTELAARVFTPPDLVLS